MSAIDDGRRAAQSSASPTDARILAVLAEGALPTAAIAARLGASERTVRHRLMRLRQAGRAEALQDGRHRLAESVQAPTARQERADVAVTDGGAAARGQFGKAAVLVALAAVAAIAALVALAANGRRPASPTALPAARPPYPGWGRPGSSL